MTTPLVFFHLILLQEMPVKPNSLIQILTETTLVPPSSWKQEKRSAIFMHLFSGIIF
jgi:hypothetical protein